MARARNLKPDFFRDAKVAKCDVWVRLLFAGLWTLADREGRLKDDPDQIGLDVFPRDGFDIEAGLRQLADLGLVERYEAGGVRVVWVRNFARHQNPHVNEQASTLPAAPDAGSASVMPSDPVQGPEEHGACTVQAPEEHGASTGQAPEEHGATPADSLVLIPDSPIRTARDRPARTRAPAGAVVDSAPFRVFQAMAEETGADEAEATGRYKAAQCAIAKRLLDDGCDEAEIRACVRYLRSQEWRTAPVDLRTVEAEIGKWRTQGRPARAAARASPNGAAGRAATTAAHLGRLREIIAEGETA